mgnify:CR=1 FL=1
MHVLFCHDTYYSKKRDGTVLSYGAFPYALWEGRFLPYFDSMTVIGRKKNLHAQENGVVEISSGRNVDHILLPNIHAPIKRITKTTRIYKRIKEQVKRADAVIIRGPVEYGLMAARAARECGKPYAIEMSGCTYDKEFARGDVLHKIYAPLRHQRTRDMVRHADAVIYATESFLQARYPTLGKSQSAPNIEISSPSDDVLTRRIERIESKPEHMSIGLIGHFANGLKGMDVALTALGLVKAHCDANKDLPDIQFKVLGQGIAAQWKNLIYDNGLEGCVEFCGTIARGDHVLEWLDGIDIYLQPSLHKGLPRSLIEAMSRACPSLSSDAGASHEVLDQKFIHPVGDSKILAQQIIQMISPDAQLAAAQNNFTKSKNYTSEDLIPRRVALWQDFAKLVRDKSENDLAA